MKIKSGFILKKVMGSYMIVSPDCGAGTSAMQTTNETGAFLWELMQEDVTVEYLCARVVEEYDIDEASARRDIEAFIERLRQSALLDE